MWSQSSDANERSSQRPRPQFDLLPDSFLDDDEADENHHKQDEKAHSDDVRGTPDNTRTPTIMTPKNISRETSNTNLNVPFIRQAVDRRNSYGVPSSTPSKMNVGTPGKHKTPNRNIYMFLQRKSSGMLPMLSPGFDERQVSSSDIDKKRLVDQFYNSINESNAASQVSSATDLSIYKNNLGLTAGPSPLAPAVEKVKVLLSNDNVDPMDSLQNSRNGNSTTPESTELTDMEFTHILQNGGYKYQLNQTIDEEVTHYLLNIDNILEDIKAGRTVPGMFGKIPASSALDGSLWPLRHVMESLSANIDKNQLFTEDSQIKSLNDLNRLGAYLGKLSASTSELKDQLVENTQTMRTKFRHEIHENVSRLNELLGELNLLEKRFNVVKGRISNNKQTMSQDMLEKVEILEFIESKFLEHSKVTRNTRFKQLNITLVVAILLVSLYFVY